MLLNSILDQLFFSIRDFAQIEAPSSQSKGHKRVKDGNITDDEPVLNGCFFHAIIFAPIDPGKAEHLTHEHDPTNNEVVAKHHLRVALNTWGVADYLEEQQYEERAPEARQ